MDTDSLRDEVADLIWNVLDDRAEPGEQYEIADRILAIPAIKEALERPHIYSGTDPSFVSVRVK